MQVIVYCSCQPFREIPVQFKKMRSQLTNRPNLRTSQLLILIYVCVCVYVPMIPRANKVIPIFIGSKIRHTNKVIPTFMRNMEGRTLEPYYGLKIDINVCFFHVRAFFFRMHKWRSISGWIDMSTCSKHHFCFTIMCIDKHL